ncbi:hypothetical protein CUU64_05535 [Bacillus sp. V5-8f]|nr:hypothetical protein CUU64_05535 [Bacillus sp. V5-8f]
MKVKLTAIFLMAISLLTGCLYPEQRSVENQVPYKEQIQSVQSAIDQFRKDEGGILPIKTKPGDTPYYQKYLIDFKKLVPKYMAEPPGNSYESGGVFQYVIIDEETNPTVKIFDIRIAQQLQDLNLRLRIYRENNSYPPFKEQLANDVFTLDFRKMGLKEDPAITSPYSGKPLPVVVNGEAELFVDYTPDLVEATQKTDKQFKSGEDIRPLLTGTSEFVPAYSLPYTIDQKTKKPIFLTK